MYRRRYMRIKQQWKIIIIEEEKNKLLMNQMFNKEEKNNMRKKFLPRIITSLPNNYRLFPIIYFYFYSLFLFQHIVISIFVAYRRYFFFFLISLNSTLNRRDFISILFVTYKTVMVIHMYPVHTYPITHHMMNNQNLATKY